MDQVRAIAKVVWEQRFWVLSVLGLIVAFVCWNMAAGALDAQFSSRKGEIEGKLSAITNLAQQPHPNADIIAENEKQVAEQNEIVNAVWETLYERQKESVLKWPAELPKQFLTYIEKLKFRDPIDSRMRGFYQNYIEDRFKGLLEIVDALETAEGSSAYGSGRGSEFDRGPRGPQPGTAGMGEEYLVEWLDQDKLRTKLKFATNKPTALQIWVTQEDLWVYETLLNVIAKTNRARGATRPDNTAIRTIVSLEVGAGASQGMGMASGHVYMPRGAGPADAAMAGEFAGEMGGRGGYGAEGGAPAYSGEMDYSGRGGYSEFGAGMDGGDPGAIDSALLANRYLGDDGTPLDGSGDLGKEFRQLPIRMELVIDQRWIPRLLLECANSPLPIEVKQLRVNPDKTMAGFEGLGGTSGSYGGTSTVTINDPAFALLQVKGVVFIYNEPTDEPPAAPATDDGQLAAGM